MKAVAVEVLEYFLLAAYVAVLPVRRCLNAFTLITHASLFSSLITHASLFSSLLTWGISPTNVRPTRPSFAYSTPYRGAESQVVSA